jgi:hypothetical protein
MTQRASIPRRRILHRLAALAAVLGVTRISSAFGTGAAPSGGFDHSAFGAVLRDCVRGQGVDYLRLRRDHLATLDAYLARIAAQDLAALPRDERFVLAVNAYNAAVMRAVAAKLRRGFRVDEKEFAFFAEPRVEFGGSRISLDHLEHEILRKEMPDPRVHVVLVCAARSCPPLAATPLLAEGLDAALETRMKAFLTDSSRNVVVAAERKLRLSAIFDWFAADFGGTDRLADYAARHLGRDVAGYEVEFLPYDWALNLAELESGHPWRVVSSDAPASIDGGTEVVVTAGEIVEELAAQSAGAGDAAAAREPATVPAGATVRLGDGRKAWMERRSLQLFHG